MSDITYTLWCFLYGDDNPFSVNASPTISIGELKKAIKEETCLKDVELKLWKPKPTSHIHVKPSNTLAQRIRDKGLDLSQFADPLGPMDPVADVFQDRASTIGGLDIIIIRPPPDVMLGKRPRPPEDSDLVTTTPSTIGQPSKYMKMQLKSSERILDDRPEPDPEIAPISLLYGGFGQFLDVYARRKNPKNVPIAQLETEVDSFATNMTNFFDDDDKRRDSGLHSLNKIFTLCERRIPNLMPAAVGRVRSEGHFIGPHNAASCVVGFKNEIANIMPEVELTSYVAHSHVQSMKDYRSMYEKMRVPCLGVTIVGTCITFYAILYIKQWRVIRLTPTLSCIASASEGRDRKDLHAAMAGAIDLLCCIDEDIKQFIDRPPNIPILQNPKLPYISEISKYNDRSGEKLKFRILKYHRDRQDYRRLYIAESLDSREEIIVKFTKKYSIALHRFCAERNHAPSILGFQDLPGDWLVIAMEYFPFARPFSRSPLRAEHLVRWKVELEELLQSFHKEDLVHGDLRDPNILCQEEKVMLIDFDWAGKVGEAAYPDTDLDPALTAGRRSSGLMITKEDDTRVLRNTFKEAERL